MSLWLFQPLDLVKISHVFQLSYLLHMVIFCSQTHLRRYEMDRNGDIELGNRGLGSPKRTLTFEQRPGRAEVVREAQA